MTENKADIRFMQLVLSFSNMAMMQLGKVTNPMTGKIDVDLDAAQGTVDLIDMLKFKTKGNLSKEEDDLIENVLHNLHLNYVDEIEKQKKAKEEKKDEKKEDATDGEEDKK